MKQLTTLLLVAFLFTGLAATTNAATTAVSNDDRAISALEASAAEAVSAQQWALFSDRLVDALGSDHAALQQAAMRLVIRYGKDVNVKDAVFDVMRVYRDGQSDALRRMAVVTLANMKSDWALKFLERSERFERSPCVQKTIHDVITEAGSA
jgi:hypothetical protein